MAVIPQNEIAGAAPAEVRQRRLEWFPLVWAVAQLGAYCLDLSDHIRVVTAGPAYFDDVDKPLSSQSTWMLACGGATLAAMLAIGLVLRLANLRLWRGWLFTTLSGCIVMGLFNAGYVLPLAYLHQWESDGWHIMPADVAAGITGALGVALLASVFFTPKHARPWQMRLIGVSAGLLFVAAVGNWWLLHGNEYAHREATAAIIGRYAILWTSWILRLMLFPLMIWCAASHGKGRRVLAVLYASLALVYGTQEAVFFLLGAYHENPVLACLRAAGEHAALWFPQAMPFLLGGLLLWRTDKTPSSLVA